MSTDPSETPPVESLPARALEVMPRDELEAIAEEYGIESERYRSTLDLAGAIHERRRLIAGMDRGAMLEVVVWGRRPVAASATPEQLAREIAQIKGMRFVGLPERGLRVLAALRGVPAEETDDVPTIVRRLKRQEGFLAKLNRKKRRFIGSLVSKMVGDEPASDDYQFLPPGHSGDAGGTVPSTRSASLKEEIEESGLFGGLAGRIRRSADVYVNQKLDEIEIRIDRKLDEIDRRLQEWRDKEVGNRIRILKITLWASLIVAGISLVYSYIRYLVKM
jgi:hypothetical protein